MSETAQLMRKFAEMVQASRADGPYVSVELLAENLIQYAEELERAGVPVTVVPQPDVED